MKETITITFYDGVNKSDGLNLIRWWLDRHANEPDKHPLVGIVTMGDIVAIRRDYRKGLCFAVAPKTKPEGK